MAISYGSVNVYTNESIKLDDYSFMSFSENWQTLIAFAPKKNSECTITKMADPYETQKAARKISKIYDLPVLWFYQFDEDVNAFILYVNGRQLASFDSSNPEGKKKIFSIPQMVGYDEGGKRRLSTILDCSSIDLQTEMLEEYFGVCLLPFPEEIEENPKSITRYRGDGAYKKYREAMKKLTGKNASIKLKLCENFKGDLAPYESNKGIIHHYYIYRTENEVSAKRVPAHFINGKVEFISEDDLKSAEKTSDIIQYIGDSPHYNDYCEDSISFKQSAPPAYANRVLTSPAGYHALGFDSKGRLLMTNANDTCVAIMDENLRMIAKHSVKGCIIDQDGDYILSLRAGLGIYAAFPEIYIYKLYE